MTTQEEPATASPVADQHREGDGFPVVCLGASAGGLEAFRQFFGAMPPGNGMAFVLIQHLDPHHNSMMAELLAGSTAMPVAQAVDGMALSPGHLYVIPPGVYLSIRDHGKLRLSEPHDPHGARMPLDHFLRSLASECRERAVCCILSGTGGDGSLGLKAVKERGGLVIAQDPDEATFNGMPRSAMMTGCVDLVLPVAQMPMALVSYSRQGYLRSAAGETPAIRDTPGAEPPAAGDLSEFVALLRERTVFDFSLYKQGTLRRRIERRMAMVASPDSHSYLEVLRQNDAEVQLLAKDLLINVTHFFRDPATFAVLEQTVIPQLVQRAAPGQSLRVWVPGCSTGEEAYSIAILYLEAIAAARKAVKLQILASDIDAEAIAVGRDGLYPEAIAADVSPARLARHFVKEDHCYRVLPELRGLVVFTVHDLLTDPPFSRMDLVSCRNVLIYLGAEAQKKILLLFHFALRESGFLLLGSSETVGNLEDRFQAIDKKQRIYRQIGHCRAAEVDFPLGFGEASRGLTLFSRLPPTAKPTSPGEIARRVLLASYAPASVLITRNFECVYYLGATDRYLRVAEGEPSRDLLAMVRDGLRAKLRAAVQRAAEGPARVDIANVPVRHADGAVAVTISVQPIQAEGAELFLVSFIDEAVPETRPPVKDPSRGRSSRPTAQGSAGDGDRVAELERDLEVTRVALKDAARSLEIANEEQRAFSEEAMSVNEEFQSTNEELETSKEELQSLNEELTALNSQLQEMVEQQRATANDLQNVLNSSDVATVFLDNQLNIRFFTPAAKALFGIIATDIGRPLSDLARRFDDPLLLDDAGAVRSNLVPRCRDVRTEAGAWYIRRVLPYRTDDNRIQGVVMTFADISVIKAAQQEADRERACSGRIIDTVRQPLVVLDRELRVVSASMAFYRFFHCEAAGTVGRRLDLLVQAPKNAAVLAGFLDKIASGAGVVEDVHVEVVVPQRGPRRLILTGREILDEPGGQRKYLLAIDDTTEHEHASAALEAAKQEAERANQAKSRFLAAASHDLRQPLQALAMLTGLLARKVADDQGAAKLVGGLEETLTGMTGILNTPLDIHQIEAGVMRAKLVEFPISRLLEPLRIEFAHDARARGLEWRVVPCHGKVRSDPDLLGQMIRNLLSNALKYTPAGKVLLGCRRCGGALRIEVWDTGSGIPPEERLDIFREFHQVGNPARERGRGHGLGLAIVERLGKLLDHPLSLRSTPGKGSAFAIAVPLAAAEPRSRTDPAPLTAPSSVAGGRVLLVVEDYAPLRESMALLLEGEGFRVITATSGQQALDLALQTPPDLVIADFTLPFGLSGPQLVGRLRRVRPNVPAIILTGDIAAEALIENTAKTCGFLKKPVKPAELIREIADQFDRTPPPAGPVPPDAQPPAATGTASDPVATVFLVDDDAAVREAMAAQLRAHGRPAEAFADCEAFLGSVGPDCSGCLVVDACLPGMDGLTLLERLRADGYRLPAIMITGYGDVGLAVDAMKAGAADFIEKPMRIEDLLDAIDRAHTQARGDHGRTSWQAEANARIAALTPRQRQILDLILAGLPNKTIAADLHLSQRTVENHRAVIMRKSGAKTLPELVRLALAAAH
ncbi:MAG: response regulator [Azospirillum sp.]|nr:response regulator [Azospirillum sp.]